MLALSFNMFLHQNQPPYLVDAPPSNSPKHIKHSQKTNSCCCSTSHIHSSNFSISKALPFPTPCYSLSTNSPNFDATDNEPFYNNNPTNQPIDSAKAGHWLRSCSSVEDIRKIHGVVVKFVMDEDPYVDNNLISMYVKLGDLVAARRVFDNMPERNVVSWTAMLGGYSIHGMENEALRLFIEFVNSGVRGNEQTYVCVLNLCSKTFDYKLGRQLHACIVKSRLNNFILDCAFSRFYARCGDLDSALDAFDRMQKRDLIAWTAMITACSQQGRGQVAIIMLLQMLSDGFDPNEFTICSVLNACGEEKELKFGRQLHATVLKKAYDTDVYIGTSLVDLYAKCGEMEDSRRFFDGMKVKNVVTWSSIIAGYARNGRGGEAISLFRMKRLKLLASNLIMVSILRACGLLRALSAGKEVHAHILKTLSPSNIFTGSALVWLYCQCGEFDYASKVLQYFPDKDVVIWTAMISGCADFDHYEALRYLNKMLGEGVDPNSFTYSSALKACAKLENIKQGKLIHSSLNKSPPALSNVFVGSALVNMYGKCGHLSDAIQVFDSMPERNLVSWKAMIIAYSTNGLCVEALKLMHRMRAEGLEVDQYIFSTVITA